MGRWLAVMVAVVAWLGACGPDEHHAVTVSWDTAALRSACDDKLKVCLRHESAPYGESLIPCGAAGRAFTFEPSQQEKYEFTAMLLREGRLLSNMVRCVIPIRAGGRTGVRLQFAGRVGEPFDLRTACGVGE